MSPTQGLWLPPHASLARHTAYLAIEVAALVVDVTAERDVPDYVEVDHKAMTAKLVRVPALADVPYPVQMEPHFVVEYYSR